MINTYLTDISPTEMGEMGTPIICSHSLVGLMGVLILPHSSAIAWLV